MRIKKFTGPTLKDATNMMKDDLGAEAIILNTRKVTKGGALSFLAKDEYEITAAIDEQAVHASRNFARQLAVADGMPQVERTTSNQTFASLQKVAEQFEHRVKDRETSKGGRSFADIADYHELKGEVESLKSVVSEVAAHLKYAKMPALPEYLMQAYTTLIEQDVEEHLAARLTQSLYRKLGEDLLADKGHVDRALLAEMSLIFKPVGTDASTEKTKVISLVGPTGVGKTTTIAKLAAIHKLMHKQDVALISADTYRIGAIEQLRTFAAIAGIPMEVVYEPSEMRGVLSKFDAMDVVFVDTVGRSQRMKKEVAELGKFVEAANPDEVHLVLSAAASQRSLNEAIESFHIVSPNRMIFSKLDEAAAFGQMLNVAHNHNLPISYITMGQDVPDDILMASNMQLAEMVYTGEIMNG